MIFSKRTSSIIVMSRIYGDEQRKAARKILEVHIERLESIYLETFDQLNQFGLGEGMVVKLTQLLLLSRDGSIAPLNEEIKKLNQKINYL